MTIINGMFYSEGGEPTTGLASDLLSGKTLNNEGGDSVVGTMPNNGAVSGTITQQAGKVIIPTGYTAGGQVQADIVGLMAGNIKSGTTVGGVAGTFTADANAVAGDILATKTAYVAGSKVSGSMANRGAITQTISTQGGQYTVPAGYHNGSGKVTTNFANLVAANVKKGVDIGGVVGSFDGFTKMWSGTTEIPSSGNRIYATSAVGFRPKVVFGWLDRASVQPNIRVYRCLWFFRDRPVILNPEYNIYNDFGAGLSGIYYSDNSGSQDGVALNPLSPATETMTETGWNNIAANPARYNGYPLLNGIYTVIAFG